MNMPNIELFSKFFNCRLSSKFIIKQSPKIPPDLKHVATLPCEILT